MTDGNSEAGSRDDLAISTRIVEIMASAAGAGLGYMAGSPETAMAGAGLAPAMALAWEVDQAGRARRLQRAAEALVTSTQVSGISIEDLESRAEYDSETAELLARVIQLAADARMAEKVSALGRLLGQTLVDKPAERFDEAFLIAAALQDLEAPHVRLLALINGRYGTTWTAAGSSRASGLQAFSRLTGGALVLPAIVATLVRHGLVEMVEGAGALNQHMQRIAADGLISGSSGGPTKDHWTTTALGHKCLTLILPHPPDREFERRHGQAARPGP